MGVISKVLALMGVDGDECKKPPELARAIGEEELREGALGFIAIVDRPRKKVNIVLCLKALVLDEDGAGLCKHQMDWANYGRTWQAYEIGAFEGWGAEENA